MDTRSTAPDLGQRRTGPLGVFHQHALGNLNVDAISRKPRYRKRMVEDRQKIGAGELFARHVDVHPQIYCRGNLGAPKLELAACLIEDPRADGNDRAVLLGEAYELVRIDQAATRVLPAHERLETSKAVALHRDQRLIVQKEFVAFERASQI